MDGIKKTFAQCKKEGRSALVTYVTAGFPTIQETPDIMMAMEAGGAGAIAALVEQDKQLTCTDIIELGMPFTDPIADGPVIQTANTQALKNGVTITDVLQMIRDARKRGLKAPVLLMGYYNPLLSYGEEKMLQDAKEAGANGFIMVDLPPEEALRFRNFCRSYGLSYVPLIAPATSEHRMRVLCKIADSFIYVVSRMGVTGATGTMNAALPQLLDRVHKYSGNVPAAVGFGVSTRDHFVSVGKIAEGVVIGSQIINTLIKAAPGEGAKAVEKYCDEICGKSSRDTTREVGIVETLNEAKEPTGVHVDKVITDADTPDGPGLADQLEMLNTDDDKDSHAQNGFDDKHKFPARFGEFGGQYVPESLMDCLSELEEGFNAAIEDPKFWEEYRSYYDWMGRPGHLHLAERLTEHAGGANIWLKREDLNHTGSHKINNALGQVLVARRLGKTEIIAETGAGQHGVATATVCAKFNMKCTIYMGAEDVRRQALNVFRIKLLGAQVVAVEAGAKTLRDAVNEAMRSWVDPSVKLLGIEAGGDGIDTERHSATLSAGTKGVLHGVRTYVLQNKHGQINETHSVSAGLDYPGVGPELSNWKDNDRAKFIACTDAEAFIGFRLMSQLEGIIPALETSHAIFGAIELAKTMEKDQDIVICVSGRGDKDVQSVAEELPKLGPKIGWDLRCHLLNKPPTLDVFSSYRDVAPNQAFELQEIKAVSKKPLPTAKETKREQKRREKLEQLREADEMKFSHSLQFNAVPDWSNHYIAYSNLKKHLETQLHQKNAHVDAESSPLLNGDADDPDKVFTNTLDAELERVTSFYALKENEIYREMDALLKDEDAFEEHQEDYNEENENAPPGKKMRSGSIFKAIGFNRPRALSAASGPSTDHGEDDDESDEDQDETTRLRKKSPDGHRRRRHTEEDMAASHASSRRKASTVFEDYNDMAFSALYDEGMSLKKRAVSIYVLLCELRSFIQLNKTGFEKVLKKYDKIMDRKLKKTYLSKYVYPAYPFQQSTMDELTRNLQRIEAAYAQIGTKGDIVEAKRELRLHLREHVVWERNTVWREMIGIERKAQAANIGITQTLLGRDTTGGNVRRQGDEVESDMKELDTPIGRYRCPQWLISKTFWILIACIAVFVVLLVVPIMEVPEQQNCLAMVVFVSLLWATEAIPLFVTSLLVPFLAVTLNVVRSDAEPHRRLDSKAAASYVFSAMWTPVIMLLLGGFTIAAALSKYNIAKMMATLVLSKAGTKPRTVLLVNMFVAMFASMWISNVAAPVLCFSIIQPILRNLPADSDMTKALLMGIALSSNIGGAASPIASPQNLIALQNMAPEPSWGVWFFVALPVCIISILLIWVLLLVTFQPGRGTSIVPIRPLKDKFTGVQWFISIVTVITIVLWCVSHQLEFAFGDMGVVAIIPIVLFFGTGILTKEDFNNFLWTIIILAAGGLSLGKSVNSSGLLHTIAESITVGVEGMSLYGVLIVFCALILVVATFISHTVAALIVLPLVQTVGQQMPEPHPNLLVMGAVLMASGAMGLPTSGFPNMTAIMMEDNRTGQRYLQVKHFLTRGVPASLITFVVIITVGYGLMLAVGF
ncbi:PHO87 [Pyrenophora seminiperda CCB06]|uniref:Tryptophan synthase n=1 Tax=Pyrenophora seminiperda CCB06 TaxID=1302712 RepID=A0A3M7MJ19_9PLEO|nr:PHO87 [Pyrenophora seminiperda CCB06]